LDDEYPSTDSREYGMEVAAAAMMAQHWRHNMRRRPGWHQRYHVK
jgi:hypothetical protein